MPAGNTFRAVCAALAFVIPGLLIADAAAKGETLSGEVHIQKGISCERCHGKVSPPKSPPPDSCLACHKSYEAVAERTKGLTINPHKSHFGRIECGSCHKMHRPSKNACNKCHDFEMRVP